MLIISAFLLASLKSIGQSANPNEWSSLSDSSVYKIKYCQINSDELPTFEKSQTSLVQAVDKSPTIVLNPNETSLLIQLITNKKNFRKSECGTFHLNAGFVIYENQQVTKTIKIGCGYNQWIFEPNNPNSEWGALSKKGFVLMIKLLDKINQRMQNK